MILLGLAVGIVLTGLEVLVILLCMRRSRERIRRYWRGETDRI